MRQLTRLEFWLGIFPSLLATAIAPVFLSNSYAGVIAHGLVALLTLPGFVVLELGRLALRMGSLHGDGWDLLSIPLSIMVSLLLIWPFPQVDKKQREV